MGGHRTESFGWPWTAALLRPWRPAGHDYSRAFCGGTLVAPAVVVTAAHCVEDPELQVVLGQEDLTQAGDADTYDISEIRLAPGAADVAVLVLSRPAPGPVAPLARADDWALTGTTAGWGDTLAGSGDESASLLATKLQLHNDRTCRSWWDGDYDPRAMLCAGNNGHDTCQGDSGGPLMVADGRGGWRLLGVTSFGSPQCDGSSPSVYMWVGGPALRPWLVQQIGAADDLRPLHAAARKRARHRP